VYNAFHLTTLVSGGMSTITEPVARRGKTPAAPRASADPVSAGRTEADPGPAAATGVRAVARAAAILKCFSRAAPELALADVAAQARLDKGTARRLLVTLRDVGFIRQDPVSHLYSLGVGLLRVADGVPRSSLREAGLPVLNELARATGTTVFLSVLRDDGALCIERVHGTQPIQVNWWGPGQKLPLHCGAAPRTLLAFAPAEVIDVVLAQPLLPVTPKSQTDAAALRRAMARIRQRGWERATDDVAVGLAALAVPVRDAAGAVIAAISLGGLTPHVTGRQQPELLARLRQAALELGQRLG
jgi:DNA-binding IclR family transcriptional regulator